MRLDPAFEIEGKALTAIVIIAAEEGHTPLEMVQSKTLLPIPNPVMVVFAKVGVVIAPLPDNKFQTPLPTAGTLAAIVVELVVTHKD